MRMTYLIIAIFCLFLGGFSTYAFAQGADEDAYDPFSDYSEFDESSDEEADIHFFRNGRFLTVGFIGGFKGFTDELSNLYSPSGTYGLQLSYFFDLRMAMQFGFSTGDYGFSFCTAARQCNSGNVTFTLLNMNGKYYFNTQNVTKGVADLNPYLLGGFSQIYRTYTVASSITGSLSNSRDTTWGLDMGAGIEIPMMRKKAFFGTQFTFHYANFPDSGSPIYLHDYAQYATTIPYGFQYDLLFILGVNF